MVGRIYRSVVGFLRSNLVAGLFVAIPFFITIAFLAWIWSKINGPLTELFTTVSATQGKMPWSSILSAINDSKYDELVIPVISLFVIFVGIIILGIIARSIIGRIVLSGVESVVGHLPVVGMLYMSLKQFGEAFVGPDGATKLKRAVAVQFPYKGCWTIGFVTGKASAIMTKPPPGENGGKSERLTIIVLTTPMPTQGFLLMVPEEETIPLDMPVQDAVKLVISGGIINPGESQRQRKHAEITQIMTKATVSQGADI
jgi:uncharacterized membrane protein